MFRFRREQSVVNVSGVKLGGQPGELATVLCGTIFYQGHRVVKDEEKGLFDRERAEGLVARQAELAEETGCPAVLHLYARTADAFERYLDFAERSWGGPIIVDSADPAVRAFAARLVSELGYADRVIYNSISLANSEEEMDAVRDSEVDSAILLAYNPSEPGVDGSLKVLETGGSVMVKGLITLARELGFANLLVDPGVLPLGSGAGAALRFSVVAKARLGLPVGSGIHNAMSTWAWLREKETTSRKCCDAAAAAMQLLAAADFLLYGPIENADFIFPAAAMADILIAEAVSDLVEDAGHPLHRLI
ncbi:MAG: Tetrahydromethanopterin S-methyltransferase subunit H [Methanosaeta sp. PtaU1.Bin060]|nr:MAG: Tetrahydromethanopterin S-methyltransferase subunit H [Methanosaeta sp. PtaU1.Bin060]